MEYRLAEVKLKIDEMTDKIGSDYFGYPTILNAFQTACYDFIGERAKHIEKTQEITDDVRTLVDGGDLPCIPGPTIVDQPVTYTAAKPSDYYRLLSYDVVYPDGGVARRVDLMRHGERRIANNNPNRKPTRFYPHIITKANTWAVDAGDTVPKYLRIAYLKKPTFATTGQPNTRIVNLPDDAIERVLLNTVKLLFNKTADQRIQSTAVLEETFRKAFA